MLAAVLAGGTLGYVVIEDWGAWDAFYMTVTTVATVGYREVHPLSLAGQAFTLALVLVGVSTALYTFSAFATVVVEGGWSSYLEHWRDARMINSLVGSLRHLRLWPNRIHRGERIQAQKTPYVIVDRKPERVRDADGAGTSRR